MSSKLIYPIDVEKQASEASKLVGGEKTKLIAFLILLANGIVALFTVSFFTSIGIPAWVPLGVQILLFGAIGIFAFRLFIFKEEEKLQEYRGSLVDSFAKYFYLRNLDSADRHDIYNRPVTIYEYMNGSAMFVLTLKFGSNDNYKARNTRFVMKEIYQLLGTSNLVVREFIWKEDFSRSNEYAVHTTKLSRNKNIKLAKVVLELNQASLDVCETSSNVDVRHVLVQTNTAYQKYDLPIIIESILRILNEHQTSFRSADFLGKSELIEFMRVFYGLGAIDLSLMKASLPEEDLSDFNNVVSIYQLIGKDKNGNEKRLTDYDLINRSVRTIKRIK